MILIATVRMYCVCVCVVLGNWVCRGIGLGRLPLTRGMRLIRVKHAENRVTVSQDTNESERVETNRVSERVDAKLKLSAKNSRIATNTNTKGGRASFNWKEKE